MRVAHGGSVAWGCTTTWVDAVWSTPAYASEKLQGKVMVVGVMQGETLRRLYEDEMAARRSARGLQVSRSDERYVASTTLTDVANGRIVLSIRTRTDDSDDAPREVKGFVKAVMESLVKTGRPWRVHHQADQTVNHAISMSFSKHFCLKTRMDIALTVLQNCRRSALR